MPYFHYMSGFSSLFKEETIIQKKTAAKETKKKDKRNAEIKFLKRWTTRKNLNRRLKNCGFTLNPST